MLVLAIIFAVLIAAGVVLYPGWHREDSLCGALNTF